MTGGWTIQKIAQLKKDGKIVAYTLPKESNKPGGRKVARHFTKRSKEKDWIGWNLLCFCQERGLVHEEDYRFHTERKWEFDWAIPAMMTAIEYEGLFSDKSRHTTAKGYTGDAQKYNAAASLGWRVLRFTALNYKELLTELNKTK